MDRDTFKRIKDKHGSYASWAIWAQPDRSPKSNIGDLSVLDPDQNPTLLDSLHTDIVMLGLNFSRPVQFAAAFGNFHDTSPEGQDYKIRYAFFGSPYYGAYMTDLFKETVVLKSGDLRKLVRSDHSMVKKNIDALLEEFDDLGCDQPTVIAFGADAYNLAAKHLPPDRYERLARVTHYSHYISKENYRQRVFGELDR